MFLNNLLLVILIKIAFLFLAVVIIQNFIELVKCFLINSLSHSLNPLSYVGYKGEIFCKLTFLRIFDKNSIFQQASCDNHSLHF
jgi:hypothetical protein